MAAEISEFICEENLADEVTIVEMREAIALDLEPISRQGLLERLQNLRVKMIPYFFINKGIKILCIGDAQEPRGIAEAVREGYPAGISI